MLKKGSVKDCSNYHTITLISHASKVKLKNSPSQASTVCEPWTSRCSCWIYKRQRNQRSNCQHSLDHQKSKRVPEKHLFLFYWLCQSLWLCGSQQTVENSFKTWEYQTTIQTICMQVRKQQLELDMKQQTGPKSGKEYIKAVYCHPAYLTYMQSTSYAGWSTSWNRDCQWKYQ